MSVTGVLRYGPLFGPNLTLRRTIRSTLGRNAIDVTDEFFNAGNQAVPHAWLLHINFGYPLVDAGAEFCYDAEGRPAGQPDGPGCGSSRAATDCRTSACRPAGRPSRRDRSRGVPLPEGRPGRPGDRRHW